MSGFSGHLPGTVPYKRLILGLFFAGVATFAQLYSPQAVLPSLAHALAVSPSTAALTVSASTIGLAVAVIPWSVVADRLGRVQAMGIGIAAATVLGILAPFSTRLDALLVIRFVEGVALGAVPAIALAYLSEEVNAAHRAAAAGGYIAGTTVGGLSGRLIAGPFADVGLWRVGMLVAAVVCAVAAVLFVWLVPQAQGFTPERRQALRGPRLGERLLANLRSPTQLALYVQAFLLMGGFVAVYNYLGFHLASPPFSLPSWAVSLLFLAYLAGTVSSPRAGRWAVRAGRLPVLLLSIAVMAVGILITLIPHLWAAVAGLVVFTAGFFAAHAVASGWAPAVAPAQARAQASSLYYLGYYGGSSVCGWLLGFVFARGGWTGMALAVTVMCAVSAAVALWLLRPGVASHEV